MCIAVSLENVNFSASIKGADEASSNLHAHNSQEDIENEIKSSSTFFANTIEKEKSQVDAESAIHLPHSAQPDAIASEKAGNEYQNKSSSFDDYREDLFIETNQQKQQKSSFSDASIIPLKHEGDNGDVVIDFAKRNQSSALEEEEGISANVGEETHLDNNGHQNKEHISSDQSVGEGWVNYLFT